ncbi:proteasome accessory factor PafA2 family protein [Propioniciclava soli]|uniref:proteasome accessory factor PafA2 family protein n=1 Tax=Propioniciclava soli TaxID=2775081 RepID=UPI001E4BE3BD|nr:proteasome accessory factor PafA2 family protein [Propioniciclava soli]
MGAQGRPGRVHGIETEYGLTAAHAGRRVTSDEAAERLFAPLARSRASTNVFLGNGGRLYLDVGGHPEYATPECRDARSLVVAQRAGDAVLERLAAQASAEAAAAGEPVTFRLFRNNVDSFGNTWGLHSNHLVSRDADPAALSAWLVPFLVSRMVVSGAGRWRRGRFTLSQRGDVLGDVVSNQTTRARPLINTRDEPHADPARHRRLHLLAGDTLTLEEPAWLAAVCTELVLRVAESGVAPPRGPAEPLAALRAWNTDPDAGVRASGSGAVSAPTVQRACWEAAEAQVDDDETRAGHAAWGRVLDAVAAGRPSGAEWDTKRRLLTAWAAARGASADDPRLDALDLRWHELGRDAEGRPRGLARLAEARGQVPRLTTDAEVEAAVRTAPSPTRARVRGALVDAARAAGRDVTVDWARFAVHDLAGGADAARADDVALALDDPFADSDPRADALAARMASAPRVGRLGGFVPPA